MSEKKNILLRKIVFLFSAMLFLTILNQPLLSENEEQFGKDYLIRVGDLLQIIVFKEADLNITTEVDSDGIIQFPLIGNVKVEGLSVKTAEQLIVDLLAQDYLINPQVEISIRQSGKISVFGLVRSPGSYQLSPGMGLTDAIGMAGGFESRNLNFDFSDYAAYKIKLIRNLHGRDESHTIEDIGKIYNGQEPDITLLPHDKILVEQFGTFSVLGQVNRPGTFPLKRNLTIVQAVAMANGFTRLAAIDAASVIRTESGKRKIIRVRFSDILKRGDKSKDIILLPGDTIVVPESFF